MLFEWPWNLSIIKNVQNGALMGGTDERPSNYKHKTENYLSKLDITKNSNYSKLIFNLSKITDIKKLQLNRLQIQQSFRISRNPL